MEALLSVDYLSVLWFLQVVVAADKRRWTEPGKMVCEVSCLWNGDMLTMEDEIRGLGKCVNKLQKVGQIVVFVMVGNLEVVEVLWSWICNVSSSRIVMVIICSVALCNGTCEWLCDSVGHQIVMLNVYYKNVCSEAPFSQTIRLNCLKLPRLVIYMDMNFWKFFNFFWIIWIFGQNLKLNLQIDFSLKPLIQIDWKFPRLVIYMDLNLWNFLKKFWKLWIFDQKFIWTAFWLFGQHLDIILKLYETKVVNNWDGICFPRSKHLSLKLTYYNNSAQKLSVRSSHSHKHITNKRHS